MKWYFKASDATNSWQVCRSQSANDRSFQWTCIIASAIVLFGGTGWDARSEIELAAQNRNDSNTSRKNSVRESPANDDSKAASVPLFQEVVILRKPTFVVQGLTIAQELRYGILSRLDVGPPGKDGRRSVSQVVLDTKLDKADELSRATFTESLRALRGHQFSFKLDHRHEVIEFTGHKDNNKTISVKRAAGQGFLVTSVMDKDGWKELAAISFFLPDEQAAPGKRWIRQMTHDWGPLGSWSGETTFMHRGQNRSMQQINFAHKMKYAPPAKDRRDLSFQITAAEFKPQDASGVIQFDTANGRVTGAQERFHVRGVVQTSILGQPARVGVEEQQLLTIRILDQNPWRQ